MITLQNMKAIMISFDQAHYESVIAALDRTNARGFTMMEQTQGRGSINGDPHYGSHAWPSMCSTIFTIVTDEQETALMERLKKLDADNPMLGLRAFSWIIDKSI